MEEHRLKPMPINYNKELFNELFEETKKLRRKLARNIDCNRFKVEYEDVVSWFDVKFIFVFNKYYGKMDKDVLKGHIINSLNLYQNRIMRMSYSPKYNLQNVVNYEDRELFEELNISDYNEDFTFKEAALAYMRKNLPEDAYTLLQIELYPPYYIINKLTQENKNIQKIPARIISEYLGWENTSRVNKLRKIIENTAEQARAFFLTNPDTMTLEGLSQSTND